MEKTAGNLLVHGIRIFRRLPSTNGYALLLEQADLPAGTVIVAEEQTGGRGRRGRKWHSPPFLGLWFSVVLGSYSGEELTVLPLALGVAVGKSLESVYRLKPALKWPNDILLSGRKVCGILCESKNDSAGRFRVVAGIGINANQDPGDFSEELQTSATSILMETGEVCDREELMAGVLHLVESVLTDLAGKGSDKILREWMSRCPAVGNRVRVGGQQPVVGQFDGLDSAGRMILLKDDGSQVFVAAGDVYDVSERA